MHTRRVHDSTPPSDGWLQSGSPADVESAEGFRSKRVRGRVMGARFTHPWEIEKPTFSAMLEFVTGQPVRPGLPSKADLEQALPLEPTDWERVLNPDPSDVTLTWIGHSSFLIQLGGVNLLCDPVFSSRASPVPFAGPWRYAKLPFTVQELRDRGVVIHAVLISHSHYDHLCLETVRALGDGPRYFVGLGLAAWFRDNGVHNVHEMDWWDEARFAPPDVPGGAGVSVVCTPCQHWSARTAWDPFKTLWCSWAVKAPGGASFFFGGDTAMCPAFAVAALPIGAFLPRRLFQHHHASPEDAVQIHQDVRAARSIGCHWGTLRQKALEHVLDPPRLLAAEAARRGLKPQEFDVMRHGETRVFPPPPR